MHPDLVSLWTGLEWTEKEFRVAKELMQGVNILPPDWADDVVQELLLHASRLKQRRSKNVNAYLYRLLFRTAQDIRRKELKLRVKEEHRPREFLDISQVLNRIRDPVADHSEEWQDLILRSALRDKSLKESELLTAGKHCCECLECFRLFRRSDDFCTQQPSNWWVGDCRKLNRPMFALVVGSTVDVLAREWMGRYPNWLLPFVFEQGARKIRQNVMRGVFGPRPEIHKRAKEFCSAALERVDRRFLPV